jgi:hypothetical protein
MHAGGLRIWVGSSVYASNITLLIYGCAAEICYRNNIVQHLKRENVSRLIPSTQKPVIAPPLDISLNDTVAQGSQFPQCLGVLYAVLRIQDKTTRGHTNEIHLKEFGYAKRGVFRHWARRVTDSAHPFGEWDNVVARNMKKVSEELDHLAPGLSFGVFDVVDRIGIGGFAE